MKDHRPESGRRHSAERKPRSTASRQPATRSSNRVLVARLRQGNLHRDALLELVLRRLDAARTAQREEARRWVGRANRLGRAAPDPGRWAGVARAWRVATIAVCRGDLARGRALAIEADELQRATAAKTMHFATVCPDNGPGQAACCDPPARIRELVAAILRPVGRPVDTSVRPRVEDPWWTEEEDEETFDEPGPGE